MDLRTLYFTLKNDFNVLYNELVLRSGSASLMKYLTSSDFFTAPSSRAYHLGFTGGLFLHSYHVYECLQQYFKGDPDQNTYSRETLFICGMFHDLCKVNYYKKDKKWYKGADTGNKWIEKPMYVVDDQFPFGHGEKSVFLLNSHVKLTDHEALAIRWHMGMTDIGVHHYYPSGAPFQEAMKDYPLVAALHIADMTASKREKEMSFFRNGEWSHVGEQERFSVLDYKET